jgi:hypothetical protein
VFAAIYAGFLEVTNRIVFAGVSNTLPEYGELFVFVFLIALGINAIMILLAPQVVTSEDWNPEFLNKLKPELGRNLRRLSMQDHYVEIFTDQGEELVLMRFGDALDQLKNWDGKKVHRSHWVSKCAVANIAVTDGKMTIRTKDGAYVPVSRGNHKIVREWINEAH